MKAHKSDSSSSVVRVLRTVLGLPVDLSNKLITLDNVFNDPQEYVHLHDFYVVYFMKKSVFRTHAHRFSQHSHTHTHLLTHTLTHTYMHTQKQMHALNNQSLKISDTASN